MTLFFHCVDLEYNERPVKGDYRMKDMEHQKQRLETAKDKKMSH